MHAAPDGPRRRSGRHHDARAAPPHRRIARRSRPARATQLAGRVGSLVSLAALALLGTALAAGLSEPAPAAERPTVTVTYDVDH